jgi:hypothetical protein
MSSPALQLLAAALGREIAAFGAGLACRGCGSTFAPRQIRHGQAGSQPRLERICGACADQLAAALPAGVRLRYASGVLYLEQVNHNHHGGGSA